jgi:hypothetical protein
MHTTPERPVMVSGEALSHARQMLDSLSVDDSDPRLSRVDLLQVANYLSRLSTRDPELGRTLQMVHRWTDGQPISGDVLSSVIERTGGSPRVDGVISGLGWPLAALRLVGHWGLQTPRFRENFESAVSDAGSLMQKATRVLGDTEEDFFDATLTLVGEKVAASQDARSQIIAAAKDCSQLFSGEEFPPPSALGPQSGAFTPRPDWPPLRLGTRLIMGGKWDEDPGDWDGGGEGGGGGGGGGGTICEINSSQSTGANIACGVVIVVVIIIIIALK